MRESEKADQALPRSWLAKVLAKMDGMSRAEVKQLNEELDEALDWALIERPSDGVWH